MEKKTEPILLEPEKMVWQNGRFRYKRPRYWYTDCRGCPHNTKNVQCALHNGCDEDVYNADVSTSILESVGDAYKDGRRHVSCTAGKIQLDGLRRELVVGYKYKNDIKDFMWSMFWMTHDTQKADIDQLEDDIKTLIQMTTQKTAGQRRDKMKDVSWDNLERIQMNIICGAATLYLTGCLDDIRELIRRKRDSIKNEVR